MRHALPHDNDHGPTDPGTRGGPDLHIAHPYLLSSFTGTLPAVPRAGGSPVWRPRLALSAGLVLVFLGAAAGIAASGDEVPPRLGAAEGAASAPASPGPDDDLWPVDLPTDLPSWSPTGTPGTAPAAPPTPPAAGTSRSAAAPPGVGAVSAQPARSPNAAVPKPASSPASTTSSINPAPTTAGPVGRALVSHESGKCLRATAADGSPVRLWTCDGSAQQRWVVRTDGTIRLGGLCMDAAWGSTANGTTVQLANCNGGGAQQFTLNTSADLVSRQADRCVDVRDHGTANGTGIQLWDCSGQDNQKWSLR